MFPVTVTVSDSNAETSFLAGIFSFEGSSTSEMQERTKKFLMWPGLPIKTTIKPIANNRPRLFVRNLAHQHNLIILESIPLKYASGQKGS